MPVTSPTTSDSDRLSDRYAGLPDACDEMRGADDGIRDHWRHYVDAIDTLGAREIARRQEQAHRLIRENGVAYNVYGDPRGVGRPWQLDPVPLLISPAEWSHLDRALIQRATLLNAILADLYGPQRLLADGHLPPALVFASQMFLRPCHGVAVPDQRYLNLSAADLARSPDGQWWVISDRTQAPSGAGYALENRIILSRIFPNIFGECQVQRLAPFFKALQNQLAHLAPRNRENPHIVLMTPGPYNETYFEHAYLARYLGYSLVEGADLTVRDHGVFLKTLGGLQPVDVILRRVDDAFCDPVELRADSSLGVPGLMEAARRGRVVVTNALGSGLIETSAIMAFLPGLCQHILGEELRMPSVATWWCGQEPALKYVVEHLDELVIKPAFPIGGMDPIFGENLSKAEKEQLVARIRERPFNYVGQERITLSGVPVWSAGALEPRPLVLRTFVAASNDTYVTMPGGLTRVSAAADTPVVSMQSGGGSKDTWILSDEPVPMTTLLRSNGQPAKQARGNLDLPSRVADNLFWLGRYVERAEGIVRLLRTVLSGLSEGADQGGASETTPLVRAMSAMGYLGDEHVAEGSDQSFAALEEALIAILFDEKGPGGLSRILSNLRDLSWIVRDRISTDTWRIVNSLDAYRDPAHRENITHMGDALGLLDGIVITLAAFGGVSMENMTRGYGWRFLDMGRRIERALHLTDLLGATLVTAVDHETPVLEGLLKVADSTITYRARYLATAQLDDVLDLLLIDETNPRAIGFQLAALAEHVQHVPHEREREHMRGEQKLVFLALSSLRLADVETLCQVDDSGRRDALETLLAGIRVQLPALSDSLTRRYLSHVESARQLAGLPRDDAP